MREKQSRIYEIEAELARLESVGDGLETEKMGMHLDEEPEKMLDVLDEEIEAPKFVTAEEKARRAKLEEEVLAREAAGAGDTLGKRGLRTMMNGTLETRRAEDEVGSFPKLTLLFAPKSWTKSWTKRVSEFESRIPYSHPLSIASSSLRDLTNQRPVQSISPSISPSLTT